MNLGIKLLLYLSLFLGQGLLAGGEECRSALEEMLEQKSISERRRALARYIWSDIHDRTGELPDIDDNIQSTILALGDPFYTVARLPVDFAHVFRNSNLSGKDKLDWFLLQTGQGISERWPTGLAVIAGASLLSAMIHDGSEGIDYALKYQVDTDDLEED